MGLFSRKDDVASAEEAVRSANSLVKDMQLKLACQKKSREIAKKNGTYRNSLKNHRAGDKVGTVYDCNVWWAEGELKKRKEILAEAKKKLAEAKRKK